MRPAILFSPFTNHGLNVPDDVVVQAADCSGHRIMVWQDPSPLPVIAVDSDGVPHKVGEIEGDTGEPRQEP